MDIFDKRDDHGDGDRDALPATTTMTTIDTITKEKGEQETDIPVLPVAKPAFSTGDQTETLSGNETSFHENQKYLQDVTAHSVPGGFPASALQSPTSENMAISTVEEVTELSQQGLEQAIQKKEIEPDTMPGEATKHVPEQQPESEEQQTEQQQEQSHDDSEKAQRIDSLVFGMREDTNYDEEAPPGETEVPHEPHDATVEEEQSLHENLEEHSPEKEDQHDQENAGSDHEQDDNELAPTIESHDNSHHEEPFHDKASEELVTPATNTSIPSIAIHTTDMTEEYLREASLEKEVLHEEPMNEVSTEVVSTEVAREPLTELNQDHNDEHEAHDVKAQSINTVSPEVHLPEEESTPPVVVETSAIQTLEEIVPVISDKTEELSSNDTQIEHLTEHIPEENTHEEIIPEISNEELHEALHEEVTHAILMQQEVATEELVADLALGEYSTLVLTGDQQDTNESPASAHEPVPENEATPRDVEIAPQKDVGPESPTSTVHSAAEAHIDPPQDSQQGHVDADHEVLDHEVVDHEVVDQEVVGQEAKPTGEFHQYKETHEEMYGNAKKIIADSHENNFTQEEVTGLIDTPVWDYQEPYLAQELYTYPNAAAQEYVDYGSSYYASAQQSLDPSPVFHEVPDAVEVPVLYENMVFGGAEDIGPDHNALSLDKELKKLNGEGHEEEEVGEEIDTGSSADTFHDVQQDAVPEAENAATMHGQDDLFEDDSEESAGSVDSSDSAPPEVPINHDQEHEQDHEPAQHQQHEDIIFEHPEEVPHELPHDTEIPQTPTTIVGDSHYVENDNYQEGDTQFAEVPPEDERPVTPDASTPLASQFKGLANSRHAPLKQQEVPVTPPRQTTAHDDESLDDIDFMPRDVTHVPWQERADSIDATPGSVRSQATLSTSASLSFGSPSPWSAAVVAAMTPQTDAISGEHTVSQDDPFIRTSWSSTPDDGDGSGYGQDGDDSLLLGRGKPIGQLDYYYGGRPVSENEKRSLALDTVQTPPSNSSRPSSVVATSSPSSLFQRMRSIFEPPNGSVAVGVPGMPTKSTTTTASSTVSATRDPYPATSNTANRLVDGGFLRGVQTTDDHREDDDEDEDGQINEKSSLLQASAIDMPLH